MNDIDFILMKYPYECDAELEILFRQMEGHKVLIEINRAIANSVQKEEFEYWQDRRSDFYRKGPEYVKERIKSDKEKGLLDFETEELNSDDDNNDEYPEGWFDQKSIEWRKEFEKGMREYWGELNVK